QIFHAGGVPVSGIASWDGQSWADVGGGVTVTGNVESMITFDDGTGTKLYCAGSFQSPGQNIARWNGVSWEQVGAGFDFFASNVYALAVFDDGNGPKLYAGGQFTTSGATTVNHIARWNGSTWEALGSGITGFEVDALATFDDGSGTK